MTFSKTVYNYQQTFNLAGNKDNGLLFLSQYLENN